MSDMSKAQDEMNVFLQFAEAAGFAVEPASVRPQQPPFPDISCRIDGQLRYFELTRAADQAIADDVGRLIVEERRTGIGGVGEFHVYDDRATLRETVERKARKDHQTDGHPLDLLIYYDGVFNAVATFRHLEATFRELQAEYRQRWRGIWLYDSSSGRVLSPNHEA
jgi:hypothetical protein